MATLLTSIIAPSSIVTLSGTQTLTNKTLTAPTINGTVPALTTSYLTVTGPINVNNSTGAVGQVLTSTGTGVQWANAGAGGGGTAGGIMYVYGRSSTLNVVVNVGNLAVVGRSGTVNVTI